jgi:hypothetical protein
VSGEDVLAVTSQTPKSGIGSNVLLGPDKAYLMFEKRWLQKTRPTSEKQERADA